MVKPKNQDKDSELHRVWYVALIVLSLISSLGLLTVYTLVKIVPSDIFVEIHRAGITITIIGSAGLFLVLLKIYLKAYTKIVKLLIGSLFFWVFIIIPSSFYLPGFIENMIVDYRYESSLVSTQRFLIAALKDDDPNVRIKVAQLLINIKDNAVDILIDCLKSEDPNIRFEAAILLGETRDPKAVKALKIALEDDSPEVRAAVKSALSEIKESLNVYPDAATSMP